MRCKHAAVVLLAVSSALAQTKPEDTGVQHENPLAAEFRLERGRFNADCLGQKPEGATADSSAPDSAKKLSPFGCVEVLFTDHPLHIAAGSIAPQNGFGAGLALVTHYDAGTYFLKGDMDAVAAPNGSWRAGAYLKFIPVTRKKIVTRKTSGIRVNTQPGEKKEDTEEKPLVSKLAVSPYPIFTLYAQGISLNKIGFFGLGQNTTTAGRSFFGMTETIVGANTIVPMRWSKALNLSLLGEVNGRFVDIRGAHGQPSPSIEALYTSATAPGLATQPAFLQFGEGLRIRPDSQYLRVNYLANFQQFAATGSSAFSFRRFTVDLGHEIPLYHPAKDKTSLKPSEILLPRVDLTTPSLRQRNGPDECGTQETDLTCPSVHSTMCDVEDQAQNCKQVRSAVSRNREGSLGLRVLVSESVASGGSVVPFYFQPTLGGSDVNGSPSLSSYQDYRFRAPNIFLLHESLDHSLYGPVGLTLMADQGKTSLTRGGIDFQHLRHSFAAGFNIRAGGLPAISVLYAFGGKEGTHIIGSVNPALLAGSPRPSLF